MDEQSNNNNFNQYYDKTPPPNMNPNNFNQGNAYNYGYGNGYTNGYGNSYGNGYGNGYGAPPPNGYNQYMEAEFSKLNSELDIWYIVGIIQICLICCCSISSLICGILTVVFINNAKKERDIGNILGAKQKLKEAKIANIVGWAIIGFNIIISVGYALLKGFIIHL